MKTENFKKNERLKNKIRMNEEIPNKKKVSSCQMFQYKSITYSIIRSLNSYRESHNLIPFQVDPFLVKVAMKHSKHMAQGKISATTDGIKEILKEQPYTSYVARVTVIHSIENAYRDVVNEWTSVKELTLPLVSNCNCCGVGIGLSSDDDVFFTLIISLRTLIGSSKYAGGILKSFLMHEACMKIVNELRITHFNLQPFATYIPYIDMSYEFVNMKQEDLTPRYIQNRLGIVAAHNISYCEHSKDATPRDIVEDWMRKTTAKKSILGEFNCAGFGFLFESDSIYSVRICARIIPECIIDGSETYVEPAVLIKEIFDSLNEIRDQHSLPPLELNEDLCLVAQDHAEWVANDEPEIDNPLNQEFFTDGIEPNYVGTDISHMSCNEITKAPKTFLAKWRNNNECISVLLNQVDHVGIGLCFNEDYVCHCTVIIGAIGQSSRITNKIVNF